MRRCLEAFNRLTQTDTRLVLLFAYTCICFAVFAFSYVYLLFFSHSLSLAGPRSPDSRCSSRILVMDGDRWLAVPTKVCQIVPLILPITLSPPLSRPKLLLNSSPTPARVHSFSNTTVHRCTAFAGCKVILFLLSTGALVVFQYLLAPASVGPVSCANAVCPPHLVPLLCGH
jgi:hypothetical protein